MYANFDPIAFLTARAEFDATEEGKAANEAADKAYAQHVAAVHASYRKTVCPRCDGKGALQEFRHVARGECFSCNGKGTV